MWQLEDHHSYPYRLNARDDDDCAPGTQFYRCGSNGFRGCCSVDPCALKDCPDTVSIPSAVFVTKSIEREGEDEERSTSLTTALSTTRKDTTSTTTTTLSSTFTLTETEEGNSAERPVSTSVVSVTETRVTKIEGQLTTLTTVLRQVSTKTETETETTKEIHTTGLPPETLPSSISTATTTSLGNIANGDDMVDADQNASSNDDTSSGGLTGPQIGGMVGGICALVILVAVFSFLLFRRRVASRAAGQEPSEAKDQVSSNTASIEAKDGAMMETFIGGGPFAPFGGRADEMVHELDNTAQQIPELPGEQIVPELPGTQTVATPSTQRLMVQPVGAGSVSRRSLLRNDPRATLNETVNDEGRPAYVNHWSQYR